MRFERTRQFKKNYKSLPQHIQEQVDQELKFLLQNPRHPSLRVKKVKGKKENIYLLSVTMNYRLTFSVSGDRCTLRRVGTHQEILGR